MDAFGSAGPITILSNACASGSNAIGHAWDLIRDGHAECVLAGGYDTVSEVVFSGFDSLQALSTTVCRPFDAQRDGLALGEGAGVLALETLDHARRRDALILGELIGYGVASDGHHLTQPHPEGNAAWAVMQQACGAARVTPEEVDYVNAHGTGTPLNDSSEALAIGRWAGPRAATPAGQFHESRHRAPAGRGRRRGSGGLLDGSARTVAAARNHLPHSRPGLPLPPS